MSTFDLFPYTSPLRPSPRKSPNEILDFSKSSGGSYSHNVSPLPESKSNLALFVDCPFLSDVVIYGFDPINDSGIFDHRRNLLLEKEDLLAEVY